MHTIDEYLNQLENDRKELNKNLIAMGASCNEEETFTSLSKKVLNIPFMVYDGWDTDFDFSKVEMSREAMVTIFNRLADVNSSEEKKTIIIGKENSVKLTVEDMRIAQEKGWDIYFQ